MDRSIPELLAEQFYEWERRGRGWLLWPEPVEIEPPFRPFFGHYVAHSPVDDGRIETGLSRFGAGVQKLLGIGTRSLPQTIQPEIVDDPEPAPFPRHDIIELHTFLPAEFPKTPGLFEQFLQSIHLCREPVSFELLGRTDEVLVQFAVSPDDLGTVRKQLKAYFPLATFLQGEKTLESFWSELDGAESVVVDIGLSDEFMRPLAVPAHDPFIGIAGALSQLREGELGLLQVLVAPTRFPWAESIVRAVTDADGDPFFLNDAGLTLHAKEKLKYPLWSAVVRLVTRSWSSDRAWEIARDLAGTMKVYANPNGNALIPLSNDGYPLRDHVEDVLKRQSRRSGMLLNLQELAGFVHLPADEVPKVSRRHRKSKAAPEICTRRTGLCLGSNTHDGITRDVFLTTEDRLRHMHVIGASGTGKSTLLFNLIRQDIENGDGVALLDPHGDLVDRVLEIIPDERRNDVVLVDPSDDAYSVGFNILSGQSELEKTLLASDLVSVFQRLSTSWGDQMGGVFNNAIRAFLESSEVGTLLDLRRFLLEPSFRDRFLHTVQDPEIVYYWQRAFPNLGGNRSLGPILTRLETFLSPKPIRYMVAQKASRLDFGAILDTRKIFLAKLAQGLIGRENSYLLGSLLISKIQQLTVARQVQAIGARKEFWLYVDEFHNFISPSMAEILTGARKYRLGLILAHQELRQLERDREVASAVLSNCHTRACFRVGDDDARKLADGFALFEARDLQNLEIGQAICRVGRTDWDFNLEVPAPRVLAESTADLRNAVISESRARYATPRAEIEDTLRKSVQTFDDGTRPELRPRPVKAAPSSKGEDHIAAATPKPPEPEAKSATAGEADQTAEHEAIKARIKAEAEDLDFTANLEQVVLDGRGRVDVALERGSRTIACEISVTTTVEHEVGNVKKCLEAGYGHVAVICLSRKRLVRIQDVVNRRIQTSSDRVGYYLPNEFVMQLSQWAMNDPAGGATERGKPRKRKITLDCGELSVKERQQRENEMFRKLAEAMKRRR